MAKPAAIKPMPFPGESPTVALAMMAGEKYGLHEEPPKPRKAAKKKAASGKKTVKAKPARKPATRAKRSARSR